MPSFPDWFGPVITLSIALGGALWWAIRTFIENRYFRNENKNLEARIADQRAEIVDLKNRLSRPNSTPQSLLDHIDSLKEHLNEARNEREKIIATGNEVVKAYWELDKLVKSQRAQIKLLAQQKNLVAEESEQFKNDNEEFSRRVHDLEKQIDAMRNQDGRIWQRPVQDFSPKFRRLRERGFPIISILNLKGGVGKTTITAHLAGALGKKGKKALMIDLDYQRSLSMMVVPTEKRRILHLERRCLQHFLAGERHEAHELASCIHAVDAGMPNCSIITNSDVKSTSLSEESLEETESRLMAEWLVRNDKSDIRLYLREALHCDQLQGKFDYVLLDCPPRLTTACVNALAASDYVLIPVVLDELSTRPLPELLHTLRDLRANLLPNLAVLGVVANLTSIRAGNLIQQEAAVWEKMQYGLVGVWHKPIPLFKTKIPNKAIFGRAAGSLDGGELELALNDVDIQKVFSQLLGEIEKEIRSHERLHAATVSS